MILSSLKPSPFSSFFSILCHRPVTFFPLKLLPLFFSLNSFPSPGFLLLLYADSAQEYMQMSPEFQTRISNETLNTATWVIGSYNSALSSVTFRSGGQSCPTLCDPTNCSVPGFPVHDQLLELTQTPVHWVGDAIQPSHPLSSHSLPAFNHSQHQGLFPDVVSFSDVVLHIRWPKCWSFSFSITPSNEYSGLISFRMDWLDLLSVQGTLKSPLQHHSSKASILQHSAFFMVQLSHPYMTTGKTIALTRWTFVGKAMSLLLNMFSRLVITFLQRSKHLFISWLQSPLQWFWSPENKVSHCFSARPSLGMSCVCVC